MKDYLRQIKLPIFSLRAIRVWQRNMKSYRRYYKANLLGALGEPVMYLFGMGVGIGGYLHSIEGVSYMQFIAPGLLMTTAMYSATFECTFGSYTRMAEQKTYDGILATPLDITDIVIGEVLWGATKSLIGGSIMLVIIALAGLMKGGIIMMLPTLLLIFLMGVLFASMAMIVTALSPSYDFFSYYFTLILAPMFFFSSIFFPLKKFPLIIRRVSLMLPLTHAVNISRAFVTGNISYAVLSSIPLLMLGAFIMMTIAINLVHKRVIQ